MSVEHSFYLFHCICGEQIQSESENCVCPACKRTIFLDWQGKAGQDAQQEVTK